MAEGDYGKVEGTVTIGAVPVVRNLVAISYAPFDIAGSDDGQGGLLQGRQVVGEATSAADGTYELQSLGFFDEVVVLAIENYGEVWKPNRSCVVGDRLRPTIGNETGYVYVVTIDGVSDPTEPTWWVNDGGNDTGTIGTATAQAIESWWSVAHAPITPTYVNGSAVVYPLEIDPYFDSVVSLVHFEDGGAATSVVDEIYVTDWTISGTAGISTVDFKFGGGSIEIDGVADGYIYLGDASLLPAGVFTMECHFMIDDLSIDRGLMYYGSVGQNNGRMQAYVQSSGGVVFHGNDSTGTAVWTAISATGLVAVGTWYHMAVVNDGVNAYIYLDGLNVAADTVSGPLTSAYQSLVLGLTRTGGTKRILDGKIDEFRYTANVARYTADFTAPAEAHPNSRFAVGREPTILDADFDKIELLLHGGETHLSTTIVDVKQHNVSNTVGDPAYSNVEFKFAETSIRMENDRIDYDSFSLGSTFTIETFYYLDSNATDQYIFENREGTDLDFAVYNRQVDSTVTFWAGGAVRLSAAAPTEAQWHHVALTYDGADFELWVNGVSAGTYNDPGLSFVDTNFAIGAYSGSSNYLAGYLEEFRVTKNAVRYTADFTVPAEAFPNFEYDPFESLATVVYPVELDPSFGFVTALLHFDGTEGGTTMTDEIGGTWTVNGNAKTTAAYKVFGETSLGLDGVGDYLTIPNTVSVLDTSAPFTIEFHFRPAAVSATQMLVSTRILDGVNNGFQLWMAGTGQVKLTGYSNGASATVSLTTGNGYNLTAGVFAHIAIARDISGVWRTFINGNLEGAIGETSQVTLGNALLYLGRQGEYSGATASYVDGHIDDFRITNGACRYTEAFTPPTEAHPDSRFAVGREPTILDVYWDSVSILIHGGEAQDATVLVDVTGSVLTPGGTTVKYDSTTSKFTTTSLRLDQGYIDYAEADAPLGAAFTIDAWIYFNEATEWTILDTRNGGGTGLVVYGGTGLARLFVDSDQDTTALPAAGAWQFWRITYDGTTLRVAQDGVEILSYVAVLNFTNTQFRIGHDNTASGNNDLDGWIEDLRYTPGVARPITDLPAAAFPNFEYDPLEDLSLRTEVDAYFDSVVSLVHFEDGGAATSVVDEIYVTDWTISGTAGISTVDFKFGGGSIEIDGVADGYIYLGDASLLPAGVFTMECHFMIDDLSIDRGLMYYGSMGQNNGRMQAYVQSSGAVVFHGNDSAGTAVWTAISATGLVAVGTWYHMAVVNDGVNAYIYLDGLNVAADTVSGPLTSAYQSLVLGLTRTGGAKRILDGKIDEFRYTEGVARYTEAFTPPTEAHPDSRYTYTE